MLIEVSGIDGSGKTTVIQLIRRHLLDRGDQAWERSLRSVSKLVLNDMAADLGRKHWSDVFSVEEVEFAHAIEMVAQFRTNIEPLNLRRQHVILDTYTCRWLATAGMWNATNLGNLVTVLKALPAPDLSLMLAVDPHVAHQRINARPQGDSLLKMKNVKQVVRYAEAFDRVRRHSPYPIVDVDASLSLSDVMQLVLPLVDAAYARHQMGTSP